MRHSPDKDKNIDVLIPNARPTVFHKDLQPIL